MLRSAARINVAAIALLTLTGSPTAMGGQGAPPSRDGSLVFDGQGWANIPDRGDKFDFVPGGERTISLWLRYDQPQYFARIIHKTTRYDPGQEYRGWVTFMSQYIATLGVWHSAAIPLDEYGFSQGGVAGERALGDGAWHHVALIQRDTLLEGWADGRRQFTISIARTLSALANDQDVWIGWYKDARIRFHGEMDELSLWSRALSPSELRELMYDRPVPGAEGLEGYWPMDAQSGDSLFDASGNAWHGRGTALRWTASTRPLAPPFRERPAFFVLVALVALGVLYVILRLYGHRLELQKRELERLVEIRVRELALANAEKDEALATVESQAQRLRDINEARSRFFTNISHEFRTPLSLIVGPLSDTLTRPETSLDEASRSAIGTALRSGRRLGQLTAQLLELARLESETLHLDLRPLDLAALCRDLTQSFALVARRDGMTVEAELPGDPVVVMGDAHRIETVFSNLLANALRFTPPGGTVRVEMSVRDGQAEVEVRDEGPGIPQADRERVFERFYQTPSGIRTGGGMGVGLALVRDLIERHGGTVTLIDHEGPGAHFRVALALTAAALEPAPADSTDRAFTPAPADPVPVIDTRTQPPADGDGDAERLAPPLILVAEDNAELRAFLDNHLRREFRVRVASDGGEALAIARDATPDVIVSDVMMPGVDGLQMLALLRADADLASVPVIFLSAHADLPDRLRGLEQGAIAYLPKPFEPVELTAQIRSLLAARERLRRRLLAELRSEGERVGTPANGAAASGSNLRARVAVIVKRHMADPAFDVDRLAAHLGMERTGLYKTMMAELETSPSDFIREMRLARAVRLLEEGHTVAEVAYGVGYQSVSSFSRRFRERFARSPGQRTQDVSGR